VTLVLKGGLFAIAIQAAVAAGILGSPICLVIIGLGLFAMLELSLWADYHWPEPPGD
jgi:H+/Cl- antiporter ClcA